MLHITVDIVLTNVVVKPSSVQKSGKVEKKCIYLDSSLQLQK